MIDDLLRGGRRKARAGERGSRLELRHVAAHARMHEGDRRDLRDEHREGDDEQQSQDRSHWTPRIGSMLMAP